MEEGVEVEGARVRVGLVGVVVVVVWGRMAGRGLVILVVVVVMRLGCVRVVRLM